MNFGDSKEIREQQRRAKELATQLLDDYKAVLSTREGRRLIWWLIAESSPLDEAFTGNASTYYTLGLQAIGRLLFTVALANMPELYAQMQREANEREAHS